MWGWWDRPVFGADFDAPNFMNKPTPSTVDQLVFVVHFAANQTLGSDLYNEASMKIDQRVGNWNLEPDVIDGRTQNSSGVMVPLRGNDVLSNRSLAINYYVTASSSMVWDVMDERGSSVDNNNVTESSRFDIGSRLANVNFASVKLGSTYDWSKPTTPTDIIRTLNVTSKTSPIGNFKASYQSDAGKSSTGFDISASMYFLTTGFPRWDGYAIYNDPEVSFLLSKGMNVQEQPPTKPPTQPPTQPPTETPTEPPTEPPKEPPTEPPTEPPVEPPTEPPVQPPPGIINVTGAETSWIFIVVGAVVAAAVVAAVFVTFRVRARKGLTNIKSVKD
jgi:hypothetical protein